MTDFVSSSNKKSDKNKYVILCETNEHESESWYYFLKYNGNEKALNYLYQQLEKIEMYLLEDISTFDLDIDHLFSEQTAKEMIKLEVNSVSFHRMFTGKLEMINLSLKKRDDNEDMLLKCYDVLGMGQIEDYIDGEFIHPEDLVDNNYLSQDNDDSDEDLIPFPMDKNSPDKSDTQLNDSLLPNNLKKI
tara:strand:+ start:1185 stop:1751 length:567 start_codon:yes stop_codon:yes gene_type:complete